MDVISLHQAGFTNAVAPLGTAFTPNQAMLLKRYTNEVILSFDSDGAGVKAALRALPILRENGLRGRVLSMTVSYTHLDVYKRQHLCFVTDRENKNSFWHRAWRMAFP